MYRYTDGSQSGYSDHGKSVADRAKAVTVRNALENLSPTSGANDHYRRGIVVGLVSGLHAEGMTCQAAFRMIKDNWLPHWRVAGIPEAWHDECVPAAYRVKYHRLRCENDGKMQSVINLLALQTRNTLWREMTTAPSDDVVTVELYIGRGAAKLTWNPQWVEEHSATEIVHEVQAKLDFMAVFLRAVEGGS